MKPVDDHIVREIQELLYYEAELLDEHRYDDWVGLLAPELVYRVPVRMTVRNSRSDVSETMYLMEEDARSIELRVRRLGTDVAWAEDPHSRTRHFVSNIRVRAVAVEGQYAVRTNLLVYRNRGDDAGHDLISADRRDVWREQAEPVDGEDPRFLLVHREALVDQATLGAKNLAIFL